MHERGKLNGIEQTFIALLMGGPRQEGTTVRVGQGERRDSYATGVAEDYRLSTARAAKRARKAANLYLRTMLNSANRTTVWS